MLALDVPQGDIDAAQRRHGQPTLALVAQAIVELEPELLGFQRVLTDQRRGVDVDHRRIGLGRPQALAPAHRAVVADHLHQTVLAPFEAHRGAFEGLVEFMVEEVRVYLFDLHIGQPMIVWK